MIEPDETALLIQDQNFATSDVLADCNAV